MFMKIFIVCLINVIIILSIRVFSFFLSFFPCLWHFIPQKQRNCNSFIGRIFTIKRIVNQEQDTAADSDLRTLKNFVSEKSGKRLWKIGKTLDKIGKFWGCSFFFLYPRLRYNVKLFENKLQLMHMQLIHIVFRKKLFIL